jgi:hypothetical protein
MRKGFAQNFYGAIKLLGEEQELLHSSAPKSKYRGVISPEMYAQLRARNDARIKRTLQEMGNKWLCHPDNYVKRKDGKVYK